MLQEGFRKTVKPASPSPHDVARVAALIRYAMGAPVSRAGLVAATGLPDRVVREAIHCAVIDGAPIVSDRKRGGYAWREDSMSRAREIRSLDSTIARLSERRSALARYGLPEQEELFATVNR
jgi:hypothetical protein